MVEKGQPHNQRGMENKKATFLYINWNLLYLLSLLSEYFSLIKTFRLIKPKIS